VLDYFLVGFFPISSFRKHVLTLNLPPLLSTLQVDKKPLPDDDGEQGGNVSRRPSKRQMEKAPEGKEPHTNGEGEGEHAHAEEHVNGRSESRFQEDL